MEALQVRDRRRRRQAMIAGLILALIAAVATYYVLTRGNLGGTAAPSFRLRSVVIATVTIPARTQIAATMLRTVEVPDDPVLSSAISDPALAVGQVAAVEIREGQAISPNLYGGGTPGGLVILKPEETVAPDSPLWRAVSVQVPRDRAVAGLINEGDHVDLFVTLEIKLYDSTGALSSNVLPGGYIPGMSTKITWANLEVLFADVDASLYVFRVDERQAEEIAHVQNSGGNSFAMSLRPTADDRDVVREEYGQTTNTVIDFYGFPVPQVIFLPFGGPTPAPPPSPAPSP